jgi:hypothetical protein
MPALQISRFIPQNRCFQALTQVRQVWFGVQAEPKLNLIEKWRKQGKNQPFDILACKKWRKSCLV